MGKFRNIIYAPIFKSWAWFFGIFPALVIILLLPNIYEKYTLTLTSREDISQSKKLIYYEDLDADGVQERIDILNYRNISAACFIQKDNWTKRQFNFYGFLPKQENINKPIFCDVTKDGVKEVFVFSQKNDSLFLNAVNFVSYEKILHKRFISTIGNGTANLDFVLRPIINFDYNHDDVQELYFLLNGGFALFPRKIMAYDFINDSLLSIENTGAQHFATPIIKPSGELLILSNTHATNNCPPDFPYPYKDTCAWLFGFNGNLTQAFKPKSFSGVGCVVHKPIIVDNQCHIFVTNQNAEMGRDYWFSMNMDGDVLAEKNVDCGFVKKVPVEINYKGKQHFVFSGFHNEVFKQVEYVPDDTTFKENQFIKRLPDSRVFPFNINKNKQAFVANNMRIDRASIWIDNFNHELLFDTKLYFKIYNFYLQAKEYNKGTIIVVTDRKFLYTYLLGYRSYFSFRFLFYLIIYLGNVILIFLSEQLYRKQLQKRTRMEQEMVEMQLKLINSQLDPHFVFNALNMVSSKILKGDKYEAYDLITNFSGMMRSAMSFSNKVSWSLKEEVEFVNNFFALMQTRFSELFTYEVNVDAGVNCEAVEVPRLLVQNAIENAIKHAFTGIEYKGLIRIEIYQTSSVLTIVITDDGIGLVQGKRNSENNTNKSGIGLRLNEEQIKTFNELYKTNINYTVSEVNPGSRFPGTKVEIGIPVHSSLV